VKFKTGYLVFLLIGALQGGIQIHKNNFLLLSKDSIPKLLCPPPPFVFISQQPIFYLLRHYFLPTIFTGSVFHGFLRHLHITVLNISFITLHARQIPRMRTKMTKMKGTNAACASTIFYCYYYFFVQNLFLSVLLLQYHIRKMKAFVIFLSVLRLYR